jgi:hypothetical protein
MELSVDPIGAAISDFQQEDVPLCAAVDPLLSDAHGPAIVHAHWQYRGANTVRLIAMVLIQCFSCLMLQKRRGASESFAC